MAKNFLNTELGGEFEIDFLPENLQGWSEKDFNEERKAGGWVRADNFVSKYVVDVKEIVQTKKEWEGSLRESIKDKKNRQRRLLMEWMTHESNMPDGWDPAAPNKERDMKEQNYAADVLAETAILLGQYLIEDFRNSKEYVTLSPQEKKRRENDINDIVSQDLGIYTSIHSVLDTAYKTDCFMKFSNGDVQVFQPIDITQDENKTEHAYPNEDVIVIQKKEIEEGDMTFLGAKIASTIYYKIKNKKAA
jgi:hypothetical protein